MLEILLYIQVGICIFPLYAIIKGPSLADRMVALDILGVLVTGICIKLIIITDQLFMIDIVYAWIILSFISILTLAKYLENKKLND